MSYWALSDDKTTRVTSSDAVDDPC